MSRVWNFESQVVIDAVGIGEYDASLGPIQAENYFELVGGANTVISDCHFAVQLNHFVPGCLSYPVAVFFK